MMEANNKNLQFLESEIEQENKKLEKIFEILDNFFQKPTPSSFHETDELQNQFIFVFKGYYVAFFAGLIIIFLVNNFFPNQNDLLIGLFYLWFIILGIFFLLLIMILLKVLKKIYNKIIKINILRKIPNSLASFLRNLPNLLLNLGKSPKSKQPSSSIVLKPAKKYLYLRQRIILEISRNPRSLVENANQIIKSIIDEQQENKKELDSLPSIIGFIIVIICVQVYLIFSKISLSQAIQKIPFIQILGTTGFAALIGLFIKIYFDSSASRKQKIYKKCLFILEQAQQISNETQNLEPVQPAQLNSSDISIIEKLKGIQIDGPLNYDHDD